MRLSIILLLLTGPLQTEESYVPVAFSFGDTSYFYGLEIRGKSLANGDGISAQATLIGVSGFHQQPVEISCFFHNDRCHEFTEYKNLITEESYQGFLKDNKTHGYGRWHHPLRGSYTGNWSDGLKNGFGVETDHLGNHYAGEFRDGMYHGYGRLIKVDGSVIVGEWSQGKINGFGSLKLPGGGAYLGNFIDEVPQGIGVIYHPGRGDAILGEISHQEVTGIAIQSLGREKLIRVGEFRNNQIDGLVAEKTKEQKLRFAGTLNPNLDVGVMLHNSSPTNYYLGEISKGLPHGHGIEIKNNQVQLLGKFKQGKFSSAEE